MKATTFSIITVLILTAFTVADKATYDQIVGKSYHPILLGQKFNYKADFTTYSMYFDSTITERQGKKYIKQTVDYGGSKTFAYYREESGKVIYIKPDQTMETVEIPANPTIGLTWNESDSTWKYTVTGIAETFETPQAKFLNCLVIQSENIDRKANPDHYGVYLQYYQRGRGYIGTKVGGLLYSYLNLDK